MKEPSDDIELIERYFDNDLSLAERDRLKERLTNDVAFRKLFDRERLLVGAIRFEGSSGDLAYLKTFEASLSGKKIEPAGISWYYYAAAACLALVALALWRPFGKTDPADLYAAYYQPHPNIFEVTVRGEAGSDERDRAFQAYDRGDYQQAASLFAGLPREDRDAGVLMLLGNSNLILERTDRARENFTDLIRDFDDLDTAGKWYLALCYLRDGETAQAIPLLTEIQASGSDYGGKAKRLLDDLH